MITDDCVKLRQLMTRFESAKRNEQLVGKLTERKKDLTEIRDLLKTAVDRLMPLRIRKASLGTIPSADRDKAVTRLDALRETLSTNPEDITKGRDFTTLMGSLKKLADDIDALVNEAWKPFLERVCAKPDETQLKQFESSYSDTVKDIRKLEGDAKRQYRAPPRNEESMAALEQTWERIRELARSLPAPSADPQVQLFLDAANSGNGAALELLTPNVLAWLKEQKMQSRFRIFLLK